MKVLLGLNINKKWLFVSMHEIRSRDMPLFTVWGWKPVCPDQSAVDIQCSIGLSFWTKKSYSCLACIFFSESNCHVSIWKLDEHKLGLSVNPFVLWYSLLASWARWFDIRGLAWLIREIARGVKIGLAHHQALKSMSIFFAVETVDNWVNSTVTKSHPLTYRNDDVK